MPLVPFSHLTPGKSTPFAIGESGFHLPCIPFMSGQEAINSLKSYYPTRRMDSVLDPQTYQAPNYVRSTTMPGTKAADLREAHSRLLLDLLEPAKSDIVRGFMAKCAESRLSALDTVDAIQRAMHVHPAIAREFTKCGMVKKAIGGGNGLHLPGISTGPAPTGGQFGTGAALGAGAGGLKPPAAPKPGIPAPPPTGAGVPKPMSTPPPQVPFSPGTGLAGGPAPQPQAPQQPPANHVEPPNPGFGAGLWQGVKNTGNMIWGVPKSLGGAALGTVSLPFTGLGYASDATGLTRNAGPTMWGGTKSLYGDAYASGRDVVKALNPYEANNPGSFNSERVQSHVDLANRQGNPMMGRVIQGADTTGSIATNLAAPMGAVNALKGVPAVAAVANGMNGAQKVLGNPTVQNSIMASEFLGQPFMNQVAGVNEFGSPNVPVSITGLGQKYVNEPLTRANMAEGYDTGPPVTGGQPQPPNGQPATPEGQPAPEGQPGPQGATEAPPTSPVTEPGLMERMGNFIKAAPQQAMEFAQQAHKQLGTMLGSEAGKTEANSIMQTGELTPQGQKSTLMALTQEGFSPKQAFQNYNNMNGWEKLGLWSGVGVTALGLLHAMSGNGGLGSIMMALLGLGGAGLAAAHGGMFDQGAHDLAHGLTGAAQGMMGQQQQLPGGDMMKKLLGGSLDNAPDFAITPALQLAARSPELASKLDQAAGVGSWGNSAMSWLGDVTGQRQRMMQQQLGLNPKQQDRLLQLWAKSRQAQQGQ